MKRGCLRNRNSARRVLALADCECEDCQAGGYCTYRFRKDRLRWFLGTVKEMKQVGVLVIAESPPVSGDYIHRPETRHKAGSLYTRLKTVAAEAPFNIEKPFFNRVYSDSWLVVDCALCHLDSLDEGTKRNSLFHCFDWGTKVILSELDLSRVRYCLIAQPGLGSMGPASSKTKIKWLTDGLREEIPEGTRVYACSPWG